LQRWVTAVGAGGRGSRVRGNGGPSVPKANIIASTCGKHRMTSGATGTRRELTMTLQDTRLGEQTSGTLRLQRLVLKNFKAIDYLELDFPDRILPTDPDVLVLGSRNGVGKTSVLEACAALCIAHILRALPGNIPMEFLPVSLAELFVRSGADQAVIEGTFLQGTEQRTASLTISQKSFKLEPQDFNLRSRSGKRLKTENDPDLLPGTVLSLAGMRPEPLLSPPLLYFHSHRKVQEGSSELGMVAEGRWTARRRRFPTESFPSSAFKLELLRALMSRGGLFEFRDEGGARSVLDLANKLMKRFAGGSVEKLRPLPDNTVEFRVVPEHGNGASFPFDGLSSGQKEVISTLFLVWRYTREFPGIVLIDEPELHLNPEWHKSFIRTLFEIAPNNQYLIATHSEDVFASVLPEQTRLLRASEGGFNGQN